MAKVTTKLQLTIPKALATAYGIAPGDDVTLEPAGEIIRLVPRSGRLAKLRLDRATRLQLLRDADARFLAEAGPQNEAPGARRWTRDELYEERLRWPR